MNAVSIDLAKDPDASAKVRSLTRSHVVLVTDGTTLDGLPVDGELLTVEDLTDLIAETEEQQTLILEAVDAYASRTRNRSLVPPEFLPSPKREAFQPAEDTPTQRAFQTANYLAQAWTAWLTTDEQRRRRSIQPRTNETPWIMPVDMSSSEVAPLPPAFAKRTRAQPLV